MQQLVTAEEIRKLESDWINKEGLKLSLNLMEKAGKGLAEIISEYQDPYLFICGKGNNGGDGMVAIRYLNNIGKKIYLFLTSSEETLSNESRTNYEKIKEKIKCERLETGDEATFITKIQDSKTIIDCLLGTGASSKLSPLYENIINKINSSKKLIIACDVPTGVNSTTGLVNNTAVKANVTVTFGYIKQGLTIFPAKNYAGQVKLIDIGLPKIETMSSLLDDNFVKENLPKRPIDSNKGTFGKTLIIAGSETYPGAAILTSRASASIGSGLTALSSYKDALRRFAIEIPEVTHVDFKLDTLIKEANKASVVIIGPGLTTDKKIKEVVQNLLLNIEIPIVLDADGINVLATKKEIIKNTKSDVVITPHPKEFSRLLECRVEKVVENKIELAKSFALEFKCTVVLKGPGSIIATKDKKVYISPFANSALAKGGTGDVLAGFIGGLIAQGLKPEIAACVGVYLHGKAGELVANDKTEYALLPQDLIEYLPKVLKVFK